MHESDNRGGIAVKTYTKSTCSQLYLQCELQCIYSASYSVSIVRVTVYDPQCGLKDEFL